MRIIAGKNRGRNLFSLPDRTTRPTSGKVREAVFNICAGRVRSARVADLFAGTGAFGLEALSRGAGYAVFVDSDRRAVATIEKNVTACRAEQQSRVLCRNILQDPGFLSSTGLFFDLVFLDPPYSAGALEPAIKNIAGGGALAPEALVIIEHAAADPLPGDLFGLQCTDQRKYGKTIVSFLSNMVANGKSDTGPVPGQ